LGITILNLVIGLLLDAGYHANVAYPGQRYPVIKQPAITVHIASVDSATYTTTVEVTVHCPASLGGTHCEETAMRVLELLRKDGADCRQAGCQYDGIAKIYSVSIMAEYCKVKNLSAGIVLDYSLTINDEPVFFQESFSAERKKDLQLVQAIGEDAPSLVNIANGVWEITLEQFYLSGLVEESPVSEPFTLKCSSNVCTEQYSGCRWTEEKREFTSKGLRKIRKGIALTREEIVGG
jgi:hypothetical protein